MALLALGFFTPGHRVFPSNWFVLLLNLPDMIKPLLWSIVAWKAQKSFLFLFYLLVWKCCSFSRKLSRTCTLRLYCTRSKIGGKPEHTRTSGWGLTVKVLLGMITAHFKKDNSSMPNNSFLLLLYNLLWNTCHSKEPHHLPSWQSWSGKMKKLKAERPCTWCLRLTLHSQAFRLAWATLLCQYFFN